jgi:hypothetical protein
MFKREQIMRDDVQEFGRGAARAAERLAAPVPHHLPPTIVDEALADESILVGADAPGRPGTRRDVPLRGAAAMRMAIDDAHAGAAASVDGAQDEGLYEQLSQQLHLLEVQQRQIRRLLEASERRAAVARRLDG